MTRNELVLEYIKILIWPIFGLILLFSFRGEVRGLLEGEFEADILGVSVKSSQQGNLKELKEREQELEQSISELTTQLSDQQNINQELLEQIGKMEKAVGGTSNQSPQSYSQEEWVDLQKQNKSLEDKSQIVSKKIEQNIEVSQKILHKDKYQKAQDLERTMFDQILQGQYRDAIETGRKITSVFPGYHNVYEIQRLLERSESDLGSENQRTRSDKRAGIYDEILKKYSWGMPSEAKTKMRERLNQ